jgi:hypothetical protein
MSEGEGVTPVLRDTKGREITTRDEESACTVVVC